MTSGISKYTLSCAKNKKDLQRKKKNHDRFKKNTAPGTEQAGEHYPENRAAAERCSRRDAADIENRKVGAILPL